MVSQLMGDEYLVSSRVFCAVIHPPAGLCSDSVSGDCRCNPHAAITLACISGCEWSTPCTCKSKIKPSCAWYVVSNMEKNPTRNESSGASDVRGNPCSIRSINTTIYKPFLASDLSLSEA